MYHTLQIYSTVQYSEYTVYTIHTNVRSTVPSIILLYIALIVLIIYSVLTILFQLHLFNTVLTVPLRSTDLTTFYLSFAFSLGFYMNSVIPYIFLYYNIYTKKKWKKRNRSRNEITERIHRLVFPQFLIFSIFCFGVLLANVCWFWPFVCSLLALNVYVVVLCSCRKESKDGQSYKLPHWGPRGECEERTIEYCIYSFIARLFLLDRDILIN